jgi:hypothetical protein
MGRDTPENEVCACCYYFRFGKCHRHAPQPAWFAAQTTVIAALFKLIWKGDSEVEGESLDEIRDKYAEVSNHSLEFVAWPFIQFPDEDWCGEWKPRKTSATSEE